MIEKLEDIGFYTLSEQRCRTSCNTSDMWRGEIIITDRCNFRCPYCRGIKEELRGDKSLQDVKAIIDIWTADRLHNIRFSGGEPTLHKDLLEMVRYAKDKGVQRIAVSTNGSASLDYYDKLLEAGCNDVSISLDACCAATGKKMCGGGDAWAKVCTSISYLSLRTYVTVGIVLTKENVSEAVQTVMLAHDLGVADIRVIPSAQDNFNIEFAGQIPQHIRDKHPILKYRCENVETGVPIRGISDPHACCPLVMDDSAIVGDKHFPCIIYLREQGQPIGNVGPDMRRERVLWAQNHKCSEDPICKRNCLDVCVEFNKRWMSYATKHLLDNSAQA